MTLRLEKSPALQRWLSIATATREVHNALGLKELYDGNHDGVEQIRYINTRVRRVLSESGRDLRRDLAAPP